MATITSLGIGSGLDLNTIVSQLVALERKPLEKLQTAAQKLQTQVSSMGRMQSLFSALQDASNALKGSSLWSRSTAASADDTSVGVSGSGSAAAGRYAVSVSALANSQTLASGTVYASSTALVGSGTLTLQAGRWNAASTAFTAKAGAAPVSITVTATDTLQSLRDKINASGSGVTASLVTDATGVRLTMQSSLTGGDNGFQATSPDAGLAAVTYNPPAASGMALKQAASDAQATVNGIAVTSASNNLDTVVDGLTLMLRKVTTAPVTITVAADTAAVSKAVAAFATAFSDLARFIGDQTKYDAASKSGGPLQGDSAVLSLQRQLRAGLNMPSGASAVYTRLSDIGLQLQRDGSLLVNQTKLDAAIANPTELRKALANSDPLTPANDGFATSYASLAMRLTSIDGSVTTHTTGLGKLITRNSDAQQRLNDRVDRFQQRLLRQYQAMDANLSQLNALNSYVSRQFASAPKV